MNPITAWAKTLCDASSYAPLHAPHWMTDERQTVIATNGPAAILVPGSSWIGEGPANVLPRPMLVGIPPPVATTTLGAILAWCGGPPAVCAKCSGSGRHACPRCEGSGTHSCCRDSHSCGKCEGAGRVACTSCDGGRTPLPRPQAACGDVALDRTLVERIMRACPSHADSVVTLGWRGRRHPVVFRSLTDAWTCVVMPTRAEASGGPAIETRPYRPEEDR